MKRRALLVLELSDVTYDNDLSYGSSFFLPFFFTYAYLISSFLYNRLIMGLSGSHDGTVRNLALLTGTGSAHPMQIHMPGSRCEKFSFAN